jgi:hypothetical protein
VDAKKLEADSKCKEKHRGLSSKEQPELIYRLPIQDPMHFAQCCSVNGLLKNMVITQAIAQE